MPLFGTLLSDYDNDDTSGDPSRLFGVVTDGMYYRRTGTGVRPVLIPGAALTSGSQSANTPTTAAPLPAVSAAAPPPVQSLGTFTTRRTELFGPLSTISI